MNILKWLSSFFPIRGRFSIPQSHVVVPDVLVGSPDYVTPTIQNVSQDWTNYFSLPYSNQEENLGTKGTILEDNCTVQSSTAVIEAILNYYLKNNLFPDYIANFIKNYYCNAQGFVKISKRYNSKMANIQKGIGANIGDVWNSFSIYGLVPENVYPDPAIPFTFEEYMQEVPEGIIQYGEYSAKFFKIIWNTLPTNNWNVPNLDILKKGLITSPICWAGSIGNIGKDGIEQYAGSPIYQHARVIGSIDNYLNILDNYPVGGSLTRKLSLSFPIPTAIICEIKII